jgi:hypothetical protein
MCSTGAAVTRTDADSLMAEASREDGWYLYGITQPISGERAPARSDATGVKVDETHLDLGPDHEPVHVLAIGSLAAVVRRVPLADFTAEALEARIGDPAWLTLAVQMHNDIIRAVHQERAILPAKFGAVYAHLDDIAAAVDQRSEALLAQLEWLNGCDEWAVHVFVDQAIIRAAVRADQALDPVQQQLATASPGRAYFIRRKLDDDLAAKTAQVTEEIALTAYQRLARLAHDAIAERLASQSTDVVEEIEVLRAALLVRREQTKDVVDQLRACAAAERAWHCTFSGPWPPYSFASLLERDGDDHQDA